jgi:protein TonB
MARALDRSARGVLGVVLGTRLREPMTIGVLASLALHAALLGVHFVDGSAPPRAADARLEVVLVNARTERAPERPQVRAQVDMDAGGNRERERALSMLPASARAQDAVEPGEQRRRAQALVQEQRRLLLAAQGPQVRADDRPGASRATPASGRDREEIERALARLQAQLDSEIAEGGTRPKRLTYGVSAVGASHARYVDDWVRRVERLGTEQYPAEARGRAYDALLVTVEIDRQGRVLDVILHNPSRHEVLNRAVRRVVLAGAPYPAFSAEMAREGDSLRIVRTWNFTNDALATGAVRTR